MSDTIPQFAPIPGWCQISGLGRTKTYEEAGAGNLRIVKVGGRSLVDVAHGLAWLRSLPNAPIGPLARSGNSPHDPTPPPPSKATSTASGPAVRSALQLLPEQLETLADHVSP